MFKRSKVFTTPFVANVKLTIIINAYNKELNSNFVNLQFLKCKMLFKHPSILCVCSLCWFLFVCLIFFFCTVFGQSSVCGFSFSLKCRKCEWKKEKVSDELFIIKSKTKFCCCSEIETGNRELLRMLISRLICRQIG